MPAGDTTVQAAFPLGGVDVACEFGRQTPLTTPVGVNVRAFEPLAGRARGGSRAGLAKYVPDPVGGIAGPVQHLAAIVDPTTAALLSSFDALIAPPGESMPDPSTNNAAGGDTDPGNPLVRNPDREVRIGGAGIQPNRHRPNRTGTIRFIQVANAVNGGAAPGPWPTTLGAAPAAGDLVVVVAQTVDFDVTTPRVTAVTNGAGDAFTQAGSLFAELTANITGFGDQAVSLSVWYRVATGAADQEVRVTAAAGGVACGISYAVCVYRGTAGSPFTAAVKAEVAAAVVDYPVGGLGLNGTATQLVVGAFAGFAVGSPAGIPATGYALRTGTGFSGSSQITGHAVDRVTASGFGPAATGVSLDVSGGPPAAFGGYVAVAASFHR